MAWIGPAIGAGASLLGGLISSKGAQNAGDTAAQAQAAATAAELGWANQNRDIALQLAFPQLYSQRGALAAMMDMTGLPRATATNPVIPSTPGQSTIPGTPSGPSTQGVPGHATAQGFFGNLLGDMTGGLLGGSGGGLGGILTGGTLVGGANTMLNPKNFWDKTFGGVGGSSGGTANAIAVNPGNSQNIVNQLPALSSLPHYNWQADPGYQWRLQQGVNAIESAGSTKGLINSGGMLKALQDYGQGLASSEYQNVYNRLATIAGYGNQGAAQAGNNVTQTGIAGQQAFNGIANAGLASAYGQMGASSAWGNAFSGIANIFGQNTNLFGGGH